MDRWYQKKYLCNNIKNIFITGFFVFILMFAIPLKTHADFTTSATSWIGVPYICGSQVCADVNTAADGLYLPYGGGGYCGNTLYFRDANVYEGGYSATRVYKQTIPISIVSSVCPDMPAGQADQWMTGWWPGIGLRCSELYINGHPVERTGSPSSVGWSYNNYATCPANSLMYAWVGYYGYPCIGPSYFQCSGGTAHIIQAPTVSLAANPTDIYGSGSSVLTWSTTNNPTSISSNFGAWPPTAGSRSVTPSAGANYYWVTVSNSAGSASASAYVYVHPGHFNVNAGSAECDNERSVNRISWSASSGASQYNIYRNGSYIGYVYAPTTSYNDYNVSYGNSYTYTILAYNTQGYATWGNNNSGAVNTRYCIRPHVTISPSISSIILGQSQTLSWTAQNVDRVSISNYGDVYNGVITSQSGTISVQPKNTTSYIIRGYNPSPYSPDSASAIIYVANTQSSGSGDVYSGNILSDPNGKLSFDDRTILSAHEATINMPGSPDTKWRIPSYVSLKEVLWEATKNKMRKNIDNMKNSSPNSLGAKISGPFNLDPKQKGNPNDPTPANSAEGQVWYHSGNLQIGDAGTETTFRGKGTIIVDGTITIVGNINYTDNNSSVGIIADTTSANAINIERTSDKLVGSYFTFGTINMK